jgi:hypothetical protein
MVLNSFTEIMANGVPIGVHGHFSPSRGVLVEAVAAAGRKIVDCERHLIALNIDLKDAIDRLPEAGQFVERATEKLLLHHAIDAWNDNDQAGVQRLRREEPAEVAGVVRDYHEAAQLICDGKTFKDMRDNLHNALVKLEVQDQHVARLETSNAYLERELKLQERPITNALKEVITLKQQMAKKKPAKRR